VVVRGHHITSGIINANPGIMGGKTLRCAADEKLTAFLELESVIRACPQIALTSRRDFWQKV